MLFRRRETESFLERMRVHIWPRRSWGRSSRYVVYRLRRLSATPHAIALGFAVGAFAAVTPYIGTHMAMAALIAWAIGGSMVAALLGTFVGNPLTYPFIWFASYKIGNIMLGAPCALKRTSTCRTGSFQSSFDHLWPILKPMTLGSIPVGLPSPPAAMSWSSPWSRPISIAAAASSVCVTARRDRRLRQPRHDERSAGSDGAPDPSRHQHRPRRDAAQRAGRTSSRSLARGADRGRGGCRQHHRASARGPPAHHRRRHCAAHSRIDRCPLNLEMAATPEMLAIALADEAALPPAWCRRSAPSAPPKAGSMSSANTICWCPSSPSWATPASTSRSSLLPSSPDRSGGTLARAGHRDSCWALVRGDRRRPYAAMPRPSGGASRRCQGRARSRPRSACRPWPRL